MQGRLSEFTENLVEFNSQSVKRARELEERLEQAAYPGLHHATLLAPLCGSV